MDVTIAGSQKGLMVPPGLSFNAISQRALAAMATARLDRGYWDWEPLVTANRTDSAAVLKALGEVSVQGPRGTIAMSKQHHAPLSMYLGQVQGDGSVKVIQSFPSVDPGEQCPNLKS